MALSADGLKILTQEINAKKDLFIYPAGHPGPTLQSMITILAKKTAASVDINSAEQILDALSWCLEQNASELCDDIVQRFCAAPISNANYIKTVLVPLLPQLRKWAVQNKKNMDGTIRKVVVMWTEKVLGLPAANSLLSTQLTSLAKWNCQCSACVLAREFLTKHQGQSTQLHRIGAPTRKHVELNLTTHARGLATWELVRTTPQSLSVRVNCIGGAYPVAHVFASSQSLTPCVAS